MDSWCAPHDADLRLWRDAVKHKKQRSCKLHIYLFLCLQLCICIHIHPQIHTHPHIYTHTYIYTYIYIYRHTYIYIHVHIDINVNLYTRRRRRGSITKINLAFTRYCHDQYCVVYSINREGQGEIICCTQVAHTYYSSVGNANGRG